MINVKQIMQKAAKNISRFEVKLVRGAVSYSWDSKEIGYAGIPIDAIFPKALPKLEGWLTRGKDEIADHDWNQMFNKGHTAPERSESLISGLAHGGASEGVRKELTAFGSGWQGQGEEKTARDIFERVVGRNMDLDPESFEHLWGVIAPHVESAGAIKFLGGGQESSVVDIGNNLAFKVGFGPLPDDSYSQVAEVLQPIKSRHVATEYTEWRGGIRAQIFPKVDTQNVTLQDLYKMTDTLAAKNVAWEPHMGNIGKTAAGEVKVIDVGIPIKTATDRDREFEQLFGPFTPKPWENETVAKTAGFGFEEGVQATKSMMNAGEGDAIARAGTSTVKAVLKAGSRIIKNGL